MPRSTRALLRTALAVPLIAPTALLALAAGQAQAARAGLLIGNQAYVAGPLKNPVNDAEAVGGVPCAARALR